MSTQPAPPSRRDLFRTGGGLAALGALSSVAEPAPAALEIGSRIYESIGVKPIVNCKGTFTIITGSQTLPEVKRAMDEASRHYVHLDELMPAVGKRLAELTGAEYGIVTAGCAAAMTHFTAACLAGTDPEKMQQLPKLDGLKDQVIIPAYSRNVYDHAVRMLGVDIVEVETPAELEKAFSERTAMVYILAGHGDDGPLGTEAVSRVAKKHGVPVLVDAAAEILTIPNVHLERGATAVSYSGGKCLRGPQCAGLLLGDRSLLHAAWINSAPHHAFGRSLKVGKEEIMGMLAAVEAWVTRDHDAEWKTWEGWLEEIAAAVRDTPSVTTEVLQPETLSNHAPRLAIRFDPAKVGIRGDEIADYLLESDPRVILAWGREDEVGIMPYMMMPGDAAIAAKRLRETLANPPKLDRPAPSGNTVSGLSGEWRIRIEFSQGEGEHTATLEQQGGELGGVHRGWKTEGEVRGTVEGDRVRFRSSHPIEGTRIGYQFTGKALGDKMSGEVDLGEYGKARWTAARA